MTRTFRSVQILMGLFFFCVFAADVHSTVLFQDDFESYDLNSFPSSGGWSIIYNGAGDSYQFIDNACAVSGTKSFHTVGSNCWASANFRSVDIPDKATFEVNVRIDQIVSCGCGPDLAHMGLYGPGGSWGNYWRAFFGCDGNIYAEGYATPLQSYTAGTWYHLKLDYDLTLRVFDVYVDGVLKASGLPMVDTGTPTGVVIGAHHGADPVAWFDDVRVSERSCAAPPSGLVSWWSGDGHPYDLIGTNDGTMVNGASYTGGRVGKAFSFDGVDDYLYIPDTASIDGGAEATYTAWVYPAATPAIDTYTGLVGAGDSTQPVWTTQQCRLLYWRTADSPPDAAKFYMDCGTNDIEPSYVGRFSATDYSIGTWHLVTGVFSNGSLDIYVNGVLDNGSVTGMNPGTYINTSADHSVWIGALVRSGQTAAFQYFNGLIDEVQVLSRALTAQEIGTIYDANSAGMCKPCSEPPSGLIAWWTGDGDAQDMIGTNHATLLNGVTFSGGKVGQAFGFDGVDDYVQVASPSDLPLGNEARTMMLWFKTSRDLSSSTESALVQYGTANYGEMFGLITSGNAPGKLYFYGHGSDLAGSTTVQPNTWYHGAVTYDGATVRLYVNGVQDNEASMPSLYTALDANGLTIGNRPGSSLWQGELDEVAIFNRALTSEEIAAIYAAGSAGMCIPATHTITGAVSGGHGTITCTSPVNQGDSSTCTITPDEDYHLATLTDNGNSVIGSVSNGQYVISNVTADHEVIGTFSIDTFSLSVSRQGTGTGTVTSDPAGIGCGSTCNASFDSGSLVTLTATPALGSFFAGWSGDCNTDGEVTMTASKSCTATFTAYTALQVLSPNGGEDLMAGQLHTIRWGAPAAMETFDILYSVDGGLTWKKEAAKTAGNSYPWTVPVPPGSANKKKCLVRVIGYDGQGSKVARDTSDQSFVINLVRLDSHTGGQFLDAGTTVPVQWTRGSGLEGMTAKVYYSLNQGLTWIYSGQTTADTGFYDWQVPLTKKPKSTCRVKVTLFHGATPVGSDKSDGNFTIRTVEVVGPNGGETLTSGQPYDVSYHVYSRYAYAQAQVYLSLDGGVTWKLRGQQDPVTAPGAATFSITLPTVTTTKKNCKLKVQLVDEEEKVLTHDTSNAVFAISPR